MIRKVADRLRRLCSRREYCSCDILRKATDALEGDRETAIKLLDELVKDDHVDALLFQHGNILRLTKLVG